MKLAVLDELYGGLKIMRKIKNIEGQEELDLYPSNWDIEYQKSNFVISSKYRSTLLEQRLLTIGLAQIQTAIEDKDGDLCCDISASDLRKLLNTNDGSFYKQLELAAAAMAGRTIGWSDPKTAQFDYVSLITRCTYKNGVLSIFFNGKLKDYIKNIQNKYTILSLEQQLLLGNVYSFKLYELLKSKMYFPKNVKRGGNKFTTEFGLAELKLNLGIVNSELDVVRKILRSSETPDYEKAVSVSPEKLYDKWYDFRKYVLEPAVVEISEKTDIRVNYTPTKSGRGAKVVSIIFEAVYKNEIVINDTVQNILLNKELSQKEKENILDKASDVIDIPLKLKSIKAICEAADYDLDKIEKANKVMSAAGEVENPTGFMISAIKNSYEEAVQAPEKKKSGRKPKNQFNEFTQNGYDFDDLLQKIKVN